MANINQANGLRPVKHDRGGLVRQKAYFIASALAANIFCGDPVIPVGTNKRITIAAATNRLQGVFDGVSFVTSLGDTQFRRYWPTGTVTLSSTDAEALVYDDPGIIFGVQVSGAAGLAAGDIGTLADLVIGTGNTATGTSGCMVDQSTMATGDTVKIEGLAPRDGNAFGQYGKALVLISKNYFAGPATII